jgi:DNA-binding MarR family transcriptional regulator
MVRAARATAKTAHAGAAGQRDAPAGPNAAPRNAPVPGHDAEVNRFLAAYIMGVANRLANGASSHYRKRFDIGMSEWRALMAIGTSTHRIVREVAEMADLDYALASKSLKGLQQRALVRIEPTQRRGRPAIVSLTPEGLQVYRGLRASAQRRQKRLLSAFTPAEVQTLWELLRRVEAQVPHMNGE